MKIGDLTIVIAYLGAVYGPLSAIAHTSGQLQGALAGAKRVRAMLALSPETIDRPMRSKPRTSRATFASIVSASRFPTARTSFTTSASQRNLVRWSRWSVYRRRQDYARQPDSPLLRRNRRAGACRRRGRSAVPHPIVRERIALVLQDPVLFSGTIAENLRYGRLDATSEDVERAARAAHAHEFVSHLAKGYDTEIAEAGGGLSGGERQRLSVARAILKNAPILILDEPTSSLDAISEEIVFAALRRLRAGRTTIVIAHRLSTVRDADRILVLDGGQIAAQGRHEELLESSQLYRRMCARLSVGKSLDEPETVDELIEAAQR